MMTHPSSDQRARFKSISSQFSLALIVILAIILLLFAVIATVLNVSRISNELKQQVANYLSLSAAALSQPLWNMDFDTGIGVVDALMLDQNVVYVRVVVNQETVVVRQGTGYEQMVFSDFNSSWEFIKGTIPVTFEGAQIGTLELVFSRAAAQREMLLNIAGIILLTVLIVIAISITSIMVSRRAVAAPLETLQRSAAAIASGDLKAPIDVDRRDEIGLLARDLNDMRQSIASLVDQLRHSNEELEDRVAERTASLDQAQQRLVDAIESASEGFAFYDRDDRLVLRNHRYQELLYLQTDSSIEPGMSFEEIIRQAAEQGMIPEAQHDVEGFIQQRLQEHRNPGVPLLQQRTDGRWLRINERKTSDGGIVAIFSDLTELKKHEAELAALVAELERARDAAMQATHAKSKFLANMSHELRTPLNAIIGYSEMLHEEAEDLGNDEFLPDLQKIREAGKHLLNLINDVLDLSKIEAGKMTVHAEEFDVEALVAQVQSVVEPVVSKNNNSFELQCAADLGSMYSDQTKLRQNLFNLLSNAAKFTSNGKITLSARRYQHDAQDWLEFVVADTGIGMTAEQLDKLFQAFSQAETSTSRDYGGTGLGLAITRQFCQLLGGDITVTSQYQQGSTFTMTLPASYSESAEPEPEKFLQVESAPPLGTVLVIDDEQATQDILYQAFCQEGFRVYQALSGREGLRMARELLPDVITLDIIMPDLDGWSVLKELKSDQELRHIPVVLMTIMGDRDMGYALGAADYITKPFDQESVVQAVKRQQQDNHSSEILVVDDDLKTRELLRRTLTRKGYTVTEAANGREAMAVLKKISPTVILLDLLMPGMDGFELLELLRQTPHWQDIPVIVVTAKDLNDAELESLNKHVHQIFQKGAYDRQNLVDIVNHMVRSHAAAETMQLRKTNAVI